MGKQTAKLHMVSGIHQSGSVMLSVQNHKEFVKSVRKIFVRTGTMCRGCSLPDHVTDCDVDVASLCLANAQTESFTLIVVALSQ